MTAKLWIKIMICAALAAAVITLSAMLGLSRQHVKTLQAQVREQSAIIDSLLMRRMTVFDVQLNVTDKSRNVIHGRYNKGTINMPQERTYTLEIDSMNISVK
jgi:hypothetical protein